MNRSLSPEQATLSASQQTLVGRMLSPIMWRFFAIRKLPSTAFWGVRVRSLDWNSCEVTIPYAWRSQNPFRSTYFAAQSGAAELSTGALALLHLNGKPKTSMLVTQFDSKYYKKVSKTLRLVCNSGNEIAEAVAGTMADGEGRTVIAHSQGFLPDGTLASEFWVTWSFRKK